MQLKMNNGATVELPEGSSGKELAAELKQNGPHQALALLKNGHLVDLETPLNEGDEVHLLSFEEELGKEVYWHTSAHVLAQAVLRLFPDAKPTIGPPIENGFYYDFADLQISEEDLVKIEDEMKKIAKENHTSKREDFASKEEALAAFKENPYKEMLIQDIPDGEALSGYRQGEFFDLCRGPHLPNLGKIKALKVLKTSGAYWRGDAKNEMLTRIYAITFPDRKELKEYLTLLEEAKKRDHKILGPKLGIFSLREEAPGMPFIHHKGMTIWNKLVDFLRTLLDKSHYEEIKTPTMMSQELWERSGHWFHYRENMFTSEIEERAFAIKPMNCPGCMLYYKSHLHSYRDLPLRISEIGNVHRYEPSGALSGLLRCRSFHQDDAHIFMKPTDIKSEILGVLQFAELYQAFGLEYRLELSTRPEKATIGSDEEWENATNGLREALIEWGKPFKINEGDGAFYGPKIDFHIRDCLGRTWQCGTVQLDMSLPERFDLEYIDSNGDRVRPVMIHRAIFGSIERFFGILIEHFAGRFPLWLSPHHVRLIAVADRHESYCRELMEAIKAEGFIVDIDLTHDSVSKKVRNAQMEQINYMITVGDKEVDTKTVSARSREGKQEQGLQIEAFLEKIKKERDNRSLTSVF